MTLLEVDTLTVHHGQLPAIRELSLSAAEGQLLAVIGANGAGKSTLLGALAGILRPSTGTIRFDELDVTALPAHKRVAAGIALVPEGRRLFGSLTLEENLKVGAYRRRPGPWDIDRVMDLFGWMRERARQRSSLLSGGEQQAVAIGRALMGNPRLLLLDEVSLGLAPIVVRRLYEALPRIQESGTTVLVVEQDVSQAMRVADEVICLLEGRAVLSGTPVSLTAEQVERAYFGRGVAARAVESGNVGSVALDGGAVGDGATGTAGLDPAGEA
ncbi:MAG TPA: ABC transporter ATP-binding protein [Micromonosporaceae bacterium]|nr:ABC transporter ATP-binding protein [Micromonosporaceae bacterium]